MRRFEAWVLLRAHLLGIVARGHRRDAERVQSGELVQEDLYLFSPKQVKRTKVRWTKAAVEDFNF